MQRTILLPFLLASLPLLAQEPARETDGMLIPMVSEEEMLDLPQPGQGAMVYNRTAHAFWFFNGSAWRPLLTAEPSTTGIRWHQQRIGGKEEGDGAPKLTTGTSGFWDLTGNAATDPSINFLGTTDAQDLRFRVNNEQAGVISSGFQGKLCLGLEAAENSTGFNNTVIGQQAGRDMTSGNQNTLMGFHAGNDITTANSNVFIGSNTGSNTLTGADNVMVGTGAGTFNETGSDNVFVGHVAGNENVSGIRNTFLGGVAGASTTTGNRNTFVGFFAGEDFGPSVNVTGGDNTALGYRTNFGLPDLVNATAIGASARVSASNSMVLGSIAGVNSATASVNVGIGTTIPQGPLHVSRGNTTGQINANAVVVVEDDANTYINLVTPDANESGLLFGTPTHSADGAITYNQTATPNGLSFRTNGNISRAVIDQNGSLGVGNTAPLTRVDISGGLAVRRPANVVLAAGANTVTVGNNSYLRIQGAATATANLSNGLGIGQLLYIEGLTTNFTINDNAGVSNCNLAANRVIGDDDTLTLIWNGTDWIELAFANN